MSTKTILAVLRPHAKNRLSQRMGINYKEIHKEYGPYPIFRLIWNPVPAERGRKRIIVSLEDPNTNQWRDAVFVLKKLNSKQRKYWSKKRPISDDEKENKKEWNNVKYEIMTVFWESVSRTSGAYDRRIGKRFDDGSV